ncbi:MAG: hypothetical protein H0W33_00065 [Gammaproteobacteria bacterium]|nr:hypothetical protein [Gammaproteobacteria bacterium]
MLPAAAAALMLPLSAFAADGYFLPQASAESIYNDNWRLQPDNREQVDALGAFFDISATLGLRSPRSDISVTPRLRSSFFTDSEDDDRLSSDDQFLDVAAYRETEQARWAFTGGYSDESVLSSELSDINVDDPTDDVGDTGRLDVRNERQRITARPSWTYIYSEQTQFGLGYRFVDVSFDDQLVTRQVDYTDHQVDANLTRQLTERTLLTTQLFASRFEADQVNNETDSVGVNFELSRRMTERVRGSLNLGAQRVDAEFVDPVTGATMSESNTNLLFGAGLRGEVTEITSWIAELSRRVNPNGTGFVVQTDQLLLSIDHAFSQRLRGNIGARAFRNEAIDDNATNQFIERDYARLEGGLEWSLTETWSLFGRYSYTRQEFERPLDDMGGMVPPGEEATANAISIGIAYRGRLRR